MSKYKNKVVFQWPIRIIRAYPDRDYRRSFTHTQQCVIWERQRGLCGECKQKLDLRTVIYHHDLPWSKGGRTVVDNGTALCPLCHQMKTFDSYVEKAENERG